MSDTLITVIAIMLTAVLIFVLPVMTMAERVDAVSKTDVETKTSDFVSEIKTTGKITADEYNKFLEELTSTGNKYDIDMEFKILDENPGKKATQTVRDKIGENVYYSVFTSQIEDKLNEKGEYSLKEGDIVSVTVKNTNLTLAQSLKNFFYTITGNDTYTIAASSSGLVLRNNNIEMAQIEEDNDGNNEELKLLAEQIEIGDYVAYNATNNYSYTSPKGTGMSHGNGYQDQKFTSSSRIKWRVLSKDTSTGEVVLISEAPIKTDVGNNFYLQGAIGYLYAEQELNEICKIYGHGVGANTSKTFTYETGDLVEGTETRRITGSGARSINVDDINKMTGYIPIKENSYTKSIYYPTRNTSTGYSKTATSRTDVSTFYSYSASSSLISTEELYKVLFRDVSNSSNISYWLASRCVASGNYSSDFCTFGFISGWITRR